MSTDPVTAGELFQSSDSSDEDLRTAAVEAIARVMYRKWPEDPSPLLRYASNLLDLALKVGPNGAAVLIPSSPLHQHQLADAVRRTGTSHCAWCPNPPAPYDGHPTDQDLLAAEQVITVLSTGPGT
jgi:hypothetical protein